MPPSWVQEQRDLRIAVASYQAYKNINAVLNISEPPSRAKRVAFSILIVRHIFTELDRQGVDELPYFPGSANARRVAETAGNFVDEYGNRLWPESSLDDDAVIKLSVAVENFIVVMFTLHVKVRSGV
jgi:hypothetical protein